MKVNHVLLADFANITQEGKLNIIGLYEALHATTLPVRGTGLIVVQFALEPKDKGRHVRVAFIVQDEDGKTVSQHEGALKIEGDSDLLGRNFNLLHPMNDWTQFPSQGRFRIWVEVDGQPEGSVSLAVTRIDP